MNVVENVALSGSGTIALGGTGTASVGPYSNNYSISLDGTNDYINGNNFNANTLIGTGDMTVSMWVKLDTSSQYDTLLYLGGNGVEYLQLRQFEVSGAMKFDIRARVGSTGNAQCTGTTTITTGTWHNVVFTRSGTTCKLYLNGSLEQTATDANFGTDFGTSGTSVTWIGAYVGGYSHMDGLIDEMSIWDEALTSTEITAIYNSGTPINLASDSGNYASSANLVGWWRFEENTGTSIADSSTNSNTATLTNGPTFSTDVPFPSVYALDFDGTDDYVEVSDHDDLSFGNSSTDSAFTMAGWVKLDSTSLQRFITKSTSSTAEYIFGTGSGSNLLLALYDDTTSVVRYRLSSATLSTGTWTHVAVTHSGGTIKLFINGSEDSGTSSDIGSYTAMHNSTGTVRLGAYQNGSQYTNGKLDELAIWDEALTSAEITAMYNSGSPLNLAKDLGNYASSDNLTAWWRLENNTNDSSGNGHNGTVSSSPTFSTDTP